MPSVIDHFTRECVALAADLFDERRQSASALTHARESEAHGKREYYRGQREQILRKVPGRLGCREPRHADVHPIGTTSRNGFIEPSTAGSGISS